MRSRSERAGLHGTARLLSVVVAIALVAGCGSGSDAPDEAAPVVTSTTSTTSTTTSTSTTTTTVAPTTTSPPTTTTTEPPPPPTTAAPPQPVAEAPPPPAPRGNRCVVRLHGKGGGGAGTTASSSGWLEVHPRGNAPGWNGYQWLYYPEASYASGRAVVARAIADNECAAVVVDGFSNGGAFAAKLACRGETFDGTLVGVVVDDPVPDHGTDSCAPAVPVALYWTGGLASTATPGWACAQADWTCEGGETIGIGATSANLGVPAKQSVNTGHAPYANPPELRAWLG